MNGTHRPWFLFWSLLKYGIPALLVLTLGTSVALASTARGESSSSPDHSGVAAAVQQTHLVPVIHHATPRVYHVTPQIHHVTPSTRGQVAHFNVPTANSDPYGITKGPDGNVWFTENLGHKIGMLTSKGVFTEYPLPSSFGGPAGITTGPDGNLWFCGNSNIGKLTTGGTFTEYPAVTCNFITTGPDHNLWFTFNPSNIGMITTGGTIELYTLPTGGTDPQGITTGSATTVWFAEYYGNKLGSFNINTHIINEYPLPTPKNGDPLGITQGSNGTLWFTAVSGSPSVVGKFVLKTKKFVIYNLPSGAGANGIAQGADGAYWFAGAQAIIGRMNSKGKHILYPAGSGEGPFWITPGPKKDLWFTDSTNNDIGSITTS